MRKTKKDEWVEFLLKASLFKQGIEADIAERFGVGYKGKLLDEKAQRYIYYKLSNHSNVCIKMGRILERLKQRKIKDEKKRKSTEPWTLRAKDNLLGALLSKPGGYKKLEKSEQAIVRNLLDKDKELIEADKKRRKLEGK